MIDLAALAALCFDASKEWTEPKVARFDPLSDAEKEKVVLNLRKKGARFPMGERNATPGIEARRVGTGL
jgi:hypothetical protein